MRADRASGRETPIYHLSLRVVKIRGDELGVGGGLVMSAQGSVYS